MSRDVEIYVDNSLVIGTSSKCLQLSYKVLQINLNNVIYKDLAIHAGNSYIKRACKFDIDNNYIEKAYR